MVLHELGINSNIFKEYICIIKGEEPRFFNERKLPQVTNYSDVLPLVAFNDEFPNFRRHYFVFKF